MFDVSHRCGQLVKLKNNQFPFLRITRCIKMACVDAWGMHTRPVTKICSTLKTEIVPAWRDLICFLANLVPLQHYKGRMHLQVKGLGDGNLNGLLCVTTKMNLQLINCWCPCEQLRQTFFFFHHKNKDKIELPALCSNLSICPRLGAVANQLKLIACFVLGDMVVLNFGTLSDWKKVQKVAALWTLISWR